MKTTISRFIITALLLLLYCLGYAQKYKDEPNDSTETVIGSITVNFNSNGYYSYNLSKEETLLYGMLLDSAKKEYPGHVCDIRRMTFDCNQKSVHTYHCFAAGLVVELQSSSVRKDYSLNISSVLEKALKQANVDSTANLAVKEVVVPPETDKEEIKDLLIGELLNKRYKVIAKEKFKELNDEQKEWGKGIYNEETTGKTDNFSAPGYFIILKISASSIRLQLLDIVTGEYKANVIEKF